MTIDLDTRPAWWWSKKRRAAHQIALMERVEAEQRRIDAERRAAELKRLTLRNAEEAAHKSRAERSRRESDTARVANSPMDPIMVGAFAGMIANSPPPPRHVDDGERTSYSEPSRPSSYDSSPSSSSYGSPASGSGSYSD